MLPLKLSLSKILQTFIFFLFCIFSKLSKVFLIIEDFLVFKEKPYWLRILQKIQILKKHPYRENDEISMDIVFHFFHF